MRETRVAVIGCGYVADSHLIAWRKVHSSRVVAVCDMNETLAKRKAEQWKIPHHCKSLSDLMQLGNVDLVDLVTPPHTHASLAVQAMNAGFDVLIEKPMTMTVEDAEKIVESKERTGVKAGVIHNWLFEPPVLEAESLVKKDYLGEIFNVEVEALSPKEDSMAANEHHWCHKLPGGRFSEMLAHPIYLIRHFLGEVEIRHVQVSKVGEYPWMKSDELCATFNVGKKLGRAYASFNAPRNAIFIDLYGEKAILRIDVIDATVNTLPRMGEGRFSKGYDPLRQAAHLVKSTIKNTYRVASGRWLSGHEMCIKLFAETLTNDDEPPVTVEDGLEVIRILEKACGMIEMAERSANGVVKSESLGLIRE